MIGHLAKEIKLLTDQRQPDEQIELALKLLADKGASPAQLPYLLLEAPRRRARAALSGFMAEFGRWPTGCRLARGSHGVTHIYDPLGVEPIPAGWPYDRPARAEVEAYVNGLAALGAFLTAV